MLAARISQSSSSQRSVYETSSVGSSSQCQIYGTFSPSVHQASIMSLKESQSIQDSASSRVWCVMESFL